MTQWETPYNPEEAIQTIIDTGKKPPIEEGWVSWACIEEPKAAYEWQGDFEPILEPTFDENGNQNWWDIPESDDPDNLCPTEEEITSAYN